ncbi:MAG TPA: glycosyltransferase family 25 protein [Blastocatellia bacterium]|nr:glycosyltransferase family 25 protein [Blastocatellia bacterium]
MGPSDAPQSGIGPIFVINLDRLPNRWTDMVRELECIVDATGKPLSERVVRYSACDAQTDSPKFLDGSAVDPFYSLGEQLFVEPQPNALPDAFDLGRPIRMTQTEIAVACSHIGIWKTVAQSSASYALVVEDDVWVERTFGRILDQAWREMEGASRSGPRFDVLYVSYKEARHGAPKELLSRNVFRPERGLWYLSGYVLSKKGAQELLDFLPCRGPIDLWINHKFRELEVRALRRSVINQRRALHSTNSYSILPALTRIGVLNTGDSALFHRRPAHSPVFAFGAPGSGLSSLAMALSMLGYRCCSDFDGIPECEFESLFAGRADRVFDAYVNVGSLEPRIRLLAERYPGAKYIVINEAARTADRHNGAALDA